MADEFGKQSYFERFFQGQKYGPTKDFKARAWQEDCMVAYADSLSLHQQQQTASGFQHRFTLYAGPGSGKTKMAGQICADQLNKHRCDMIVVVVPSRNVRRKFQAELRHWFGIHLVTFHRRKYLEGIPRGRDGYILTYAHLIQDPEFHAELISSKTLVIFDEVHHLADQQGWGIAAGRAFSGAGFVISMSGTPWRSNGETIPFIEYAKESGDLKIFKAEKPNGFSYGMERSIADRECRKPIFIYRTGENLQVELRYGTETGRTIVTFADKLNDRQSSDRLRGAVRFGSVPRRAMLCDALDECRRENRKVIIFLGGDSNTDTTPTEDAKELLPEELRKLGYSEEDWEIIVSDDAAAQDKLDHFGASKKWILISINMVSEGTDIPELSAAIFLSIVTTKQSVWQRIGRVIRKDGRTHAAKIFMFDDPVYREIAIEIIQGIKKIEAEDPRVKTADVNGGPAAGAEGPPARRRSESLGIADGGDTLIQFDKLIFSPKEWEAERELLRHANLPSSDYEVGFSLARERARTELAFEP